MAPLRSLGNPISSFIDFYARTGLDAAKPLYNPLYADDLFSTYLWDGTGASQTITNGIDLTEGGLIWTKYRNALEHHVLYDSERGKTGTYYDVLYSNLSNVQSTSNSWGPTAFNSDGFTLAGNNREFNGSGDDGYASWTFRKAPGFFDVVTYSGTGLARTIPHNLGSTPGMILIKATGQAYDWKVYHRSLGASKYIVLNSTDAAVTSDTVHWNSTEPTSTHFSLGTGVGVNASGESFVAYIFAHDDQSFGDDGDEAIIKCGSYTATGSAQTVNLGFEPQFLITKKSSGTGEWRVNDMMRGIVTGGADTQVNANSSSAEITGNVTCDLTPRGFITNGSQNDSGGTYIYIAIRRPHKPPEAGTDVFAIDTKAGTSPPPPTYNSGFPVDVSWQKDTTAGSWMVKTRLTGEGQVIKFDSTTSESNNPSSLVTFDRMDGIGTATSSDSNNYNWMFKRAPGFFDVATWTGDGVTGRTINHNLTVPPEFMLVKRRSGTENWYAYHKQPGATKSAFLGSVAFSSSSVWNDTEPTATTIALLGDSAVNGSGETYVGFFFATLPGISKVGSYTGTGQALNVDCGFTNGARFVLIKRIDSTGDWVVYDTSRGIVAGNDPELALNTNSAQATNKDKVDPYSQGFALTTDQGDTNISGGTYLFLAIA